MDSRMFRISLFLILSLLCGWLNWAAPAGRLVWKTTAQKYAAQRGETNAFFTFDFVNESADDVIVKVVHASCPCTVARWPSTLPARLESGGTGQLEVNVDLRDRWES